MDRRGELSDTVSGLLSDMVVLLPPAVSAFSSLVSGTNGQRETALEHLDALEAETEIRHTDILRRAAKCGIAGRQRQEIVGMLSGLAEAVDRLQHTGFLFLAFDHPQLPPQFARHIDVLVRLTWTVRCSVDFTDDPERIGEQIRLVRADRCRMHRNDHLILSDTLMPGHDPIRAAQIRLLLAGIDRAAAEIENFGRDLRSVSLWEI